MENIFLMSKNFQFNIEVLKNKKWSILIPLLLTCLQYTTLMAESEEELKSLLMKVKEESEKDGLKLNIEKNKIMLSGPITSWQIDGEAMKTATDFFFLGSKITADGDCRHEIKRCLLLGRKVMTNLGQFSCSAKDTTCFWSYRLNC